MNSKLIKACLAGTAAVAVAAGGTTFAAWSDFQVDSGNAVGADVLALDVDESTSSTFNDVKLAPGTARDIAFYVASRNGETVPAAKLTMTLKKLTGTENGCSSNSEASLEKGSETTSSDVAAPCNVNAGQSGLAPALKGHFAEQALYYVQTKKSSNPSTCDQSGLTTRQGNTKLSLMNDVPVNLLGVGETLAGGEGVCVQAQVFMPNNLGQYGLVADDKSQGDSATFDVRFDLTQAP